MAEDIDEYELLPHKEIEELKEELARLKEFEIAPSKKLQVSLLELNSKLDKLLTIFEDAAHEMRVEEGSLRFTEKMRPVLDKMNKLIEQNAEMAQAILALADMIKEGGSQRVSQTGEGLPELPEAQDEGLPPLPGEELEGPPGYPPMPPPNGRRPGLEAAAEANLPGKGLPLPPMPKRRTFGL